MRGVNIVIVDDEPMVTSTLKTLLGLEGFMSVQFFNNPFEALEFLKLSEPDLIISDFMMPQMNGIEFLRHAKEFYPDTSMILLTGYADKENAIKAINEVGIYKYIEKPWDNADLILNIKSALETTRLKRELAQKNCELELHVNHLEELVKEKTRDIELSNRKLNSIISNCADGLLVIDDTAKIVQSNPAADLLFKSNTLEGKNIFEFVINEKNIDVRDVCKDNKSKILEDFSVIDYENDRKIPVEIKLTPFQSDEFGGNKFLAVIRDVTHQKEAERLRDDFIATLTHDLRTPLLACIQTLDFFLDGTLGECDEKQKNILATMKKSNADMLGLVNALLEVYKYEAGRLVLCKTKFNPKELVENCVKELSSLALKKNITLKVCGEDLTIEADKNEIRRVVSNLLGNAIAYSPSNSCVSVIFGNCENDFFLKVKDEGGGISDEDIKKLFKRFSQGTSKKRSVSTGLGLYLSNQIVHAHKGKIWAESCNHGSEFCFTLKNAMLIHTNVR